MIILVRDLRHWAHTWPAPNIGLSTALIKKQFDKTDIQKDNAIVYSVATGHLLQLLNALQITPLKVFIHPIMEMISSQNLVKIARLLNIEWKALITYLLNRAENPRPFITIHNSYLIQQSNRVMIRCREPVNIHSC